MLLRDLSLDCFRIIWSYMSTMTLVPLFATLDKKVMSLISQPGALLNLQMFPLEEPDLHWAYSLLLKSVVSVQELTVLPFSRAQPPLSLLQRAKPTHLRIDVDQWNLHVTDLYYYSVSAPQAIAGVHSTLIDILALSDRLISLVLIDSGSSRAIDWLTWLPDAYFLHLPNINALETLRIEKIQNFGTADNIAQLPVSLTDLFISTSKRNSRPALDIDAAFRHLKNLIRFEVVGYFTLGVESGVNLPLMHLTSQDRAFSSLPDSLETLVLSTVVFPSHLLQAPSMRISRLSTFYWTFFDQGGSDKPISTIELSLADLMPPTLQHLRLHITAAQKVRITSLPLNLVTYDELTNGADVYHLLPMVQPLRKLERLSFRYDGALSKQNQSANGFMPLYNLPPTLKMLHMEAFPRLSTDDIKLLPPSLELLKLDQQSLTGFIEPFRSHLPNCALVILREVRLSLEGHGSFFHKLLAPAMDGNILRLSDLQRIHSNWEKQNKASVPLSICFQELCFPNSDSQKKTGKSRKNARNNAKTTSSVDAAAPTSSNEYDVSSSSASSSSQGFQNTLRLELLPLASCHSELKLKTFTPHENFPKVFPNLTSLEVNVEKLILLASSLPRMLTSLDLHNTLINLNPYQLPSSLTKLTSSRALDVHSPYETNHEKLPQLTYLCTPLWTWPFKLLSSLLEKNLEVLHAQITELPDYNVIPFLKDFVSAKNVSNLDLMIRYTPTGTFSLNLQPEHGLADWTFIQRCTEEYFQTMLQTTPCPPFPSDSIPSLPESNESHLDRLNATRTSKTLYERLNGCVKFSALKGASLAIPLALPVYASKIRIDQLVRLSIPGTRLPRGQDGFSPDLTHFNFEDGPSHNYSLEEYLDPKESAPEALKGHIVSHLTNLKHLELSKVDRPDFWWNALPAQLVTLIISTNSTPSNLGTQFPPCLKTLVVESTSSLSLQTLSFRLSALPKSLVHFAFKSLPLDIHDIASEAREALDLPNLQNLLFTTLHDLSAIAVFRMLPKAVSNCFKVQEVVPSPSNRSGLHAKLSVLNVRSTTEAYKAMASYMKYRSFDTDVKIIKKLAFDNSE